MKNVNDFFVFLGHWPSVGSFRFNIDILTTNLINLSVVFGVLFLLEREYVGINYLKNKLGTSLSL